MGWCSGTKVFDNIMDYVIGDKQGKNPEEFIKSIILELQHMDWDCEPDSKYFEHSLVKKCLLDLDPSWKESYDYLDEDRNWMKHREESYSGNYLEE